MSKKKELVLTAHQNNVLLEAVHIHFCRKGTYRLSSISRRADILTAYFLTAKILLSQNNEIIEIKQQELEDKKILVKFLHGVMNDRYEGMYAYEVQMMHEALEKKIDTSIYESDVYIAYQFVLASGVISRILAKENIQVPLFLLDIHKENTLRILNKIDLGLSCKSAKAFYNTPSKYIHTSSIVKAEADTESMELAIKMAVIQTHLAEAFIGNIPERMNKYIEAINIYNYPEEKDQMLTLLHDGSIARKAVYLHRMQEIENMVVEFNKAERNGFDVVLVTVVESIDYCKKNKINSFLAVTNVIMNNLLVAAFKHKNIRKVKEKELSEIIKYTGNKGKIDHKVLELVTSIGNYIEGYYQNVHERLCAYSINTAIKQALGTMCKYEPDLFKPSVKKEEAK